MHIREIDHFGHESGDDNPIIDPYGTRPVALHSDFKVSNTKLWMFERITGRMVHRLFIELPCSMS